MIVYNATYHNIYLVNGAEKNGANKNVNSIEKMPTAPTERNTANQKLKQN